jgi:hypothetical protein
MPITNYDNGVSSFGMPLTGGARLGGFWGKTYFVDYDNGDSSYDGLTPDTPMKYPATAVAAATINDVIYIRNREQDITSTDGETILPESTTNFTIAEAKTHLSLIGASNVSHIPKQAAGYAVILKGTATAVTTPVIDVQAPFCLIENLGFHRGGSTAGGLIALSGNSTSARAMGAVINNCLFRLYSNNTEAAIYNIDNWFTNIYNCDFHDCNVGIMYRGSSSTIRRNMIANCIFRNQTAASVSANILFSGSNGQDNTIMDCDFVGEIPTATDHTSVATASLILANEAIQGTIVRCTYNSDTTEGTVTVTANGLTQIDCAQTLWVAGDGSGGVVGA